MKYAYNSASEKKKNYEDLARERQVNDCIYFNWTYNVWDNCTFTSTHDELKCTSCLKFKGEKCLNYEKGREIMTDNVKYRYDAERQDYLTPPQFINDLLKRLNRKEFDLDTCCSQKNIPAKEHYINGEKDGLKLEWKQLNWCNPPFNECIKWVKKAYHEQIIGHQTLMLIPARTETKFYHDYILGKDNVDVTFLRKGLRFLNPETKEEMGVYKNALALIYFI